MGVVVPSILLVASTSYGFLCREDEKRSLLWYYEWVNGHDQS